MEYQLIDNQEKNRFEVHIDGHIAFEDYKLFEGGIAYVHTEVPPELAGKGVGSFLAKSVLEHARTNKLWVNPICPFIKAYVDKHREYWPISTFHKSLL